jgi:uncharacterized protein YjiS (DUF1127 family)
MSTRIAKEEMALMMPSSIGHYFKDDPADMPASANQGTSFFDRLAKMVSWIATLPRRRAVMHELYSLSEHELADIGLTRAELPMVFDAEFAAARNAANGNVRSQGRSVAA